ncbi:MAG TPA: hypothetical protein VEX69_03680 [Candidatus Limnocylindria bacterium]|nr:hypothetical protein [Candidatus Limnocylindria bacterium]
MSIFDSSEEHPPAKIRRYIITGVAFILLVAGGCWYLLRFHTEKQIVRQFLGAIVAGNMQQAYQMYNPGPAYSFKDFLEDWGDKSYYGPVKSYRIESAEEEKRGPEPPSGVNITVEVSPYSPFPPNNDVAKQSKTKEVRLRVEYKDHAIGFAP